jgi:hypothetical protein
MVVDVYISFPSSQKNQEENFYLKVKQMLDISVKMK